MATRWIGSIAPMCIEIHTSEDYLHFEDNGPAMAHHHLVDSVKARLSKANPSSLTYNSASTGKGEVVTSASDHVAYNSREKEARGTLAYFALTLSRLAELGVDNRPPTGRLQYTRRTSRRAKTARTYTVTARTVLRIGSGFVHQQRVQEREPELKCIYLRRVTQPVFARRGLIFPGPPALALRPCICLRLRARVEPIHLNDSIRIRSPRGIWIRSQPVRRKWYMRRPSSSCNGRSGRDSDERRDVGDHQLTGIENLVLV
ncbi:hypothetical protein BJV78DRAFT_1152594 [Lactifluus subvellereus]|nr:hypothetical protein BJV78DRAFT_1152594 [Lactifluus subvellereus]